MVLSTHLEVIRNEQDVSWLICRFLKNPFVHYSQFYIRRNSHLNKHVSYHSHLCFCLLHCLGYCRTYKYKFPYSCDSLLTPVLVQTSDPKLLLELQSMEGRQYVLYNPSRTHIY